MAGDAQPSEIVVRRPLWLLGIGLLLFLLPAMVVAVVPDKASAFLCFSPFLLIGAVAMAAGVGCKQVLFADRDEIVVSWEPIGWVSTQLKRDEISFVSVARIERSFISINDFFVKRDSVVIWGITATMRDGSVRTVLNRVTPGWGKHLTDWIRERTGIR